MVSSWSLWDPHADSFATSHYVSPSLCCMVLMHAIYSERTLWDEESGTRVGPHAIAWPPKLSP